MLEARQEKQQLDDLRGEVVARHDAALVGQPDLPPALLVAGLEAPGPDLGAARAAFGVRRVELTLRDRLAIAFEAHRSAEENARHFKAERVPGARELFDLRLEALRKGRGEWPKVRQALRTYAQARQQYAQSLVDLRRAEVAIGGYLQADGLADPPPPPSQGQPPRDQEEKQLQDGPQQPFVGQGGRGPEDRLGNQLPQVFSGPPTR